MMDAMDDTFDDDSKRNRTETVDLNGDASLNVDISDAMSERDKVLFTVHTKTSLPDFKKNEFSVTRYHEEFIWLHDQYEEKEEYAGVILPPPPPRPDFDASREKLQKLGEGEGTMTKDEFTKMKTELEAEYLATFKKTVAMHEVFLQRLAAHPILRSDLNFRVFLEFDQDLSVRGKNKKEKVVGFMRNVAKTADEAILTTQRDEDPFFRQERFFIVDYHNNIRDATMKADKLVKQRKSLTDCLIKISSCFTTLASIEHMSLTRYFNRVAEFYEKNRKIESRIASDEDLKLSDTLRYYMNDSQAAKSLLYRRSRSLADYENANKALEKARAKNKDIHAAEEAQNTSYEKFKTISDTARTELEDFKVRRIAYFKKNLVDLAELEIKHAKSQVQLIKSALSALKNDDSVLMTDSNNPTAVESSATTVS